MKKILIIEDELSLGDVLVQKLRAGQFDVTLARNGQEGLTLMKEMIPNLVITDVSLPGLSGFEILSQKKDDPKISDIPVIMLTNSTKQLSAADMITLKISDFLVKSQLTPSDILLRAQLVLEKAEKPTDSNRIFNALAGKHILIVEDDVFLKNILSHRISGAGAILVGAGSGEAALEEIAKQDFDMVLLDLLLPGMTGMDVLKKLRGDSKTEKLPVIIISNFSQPEYLKQAAEMNARYIVKAVVTPDEIIASINESI